MTHEVRIEQGRAAGTTHNGVHEFLGLPYAAPPVGPLRWAPPRPPATWAGVRPATSFGNAAVQTVGTGFGLHAAQSEDCLYLNVWTSTLDTAARQPVMVWIHGGGFLNGAASMAEWTGEHLARLGVTVVSLNYRLGAFGFATHSATGANFAVLDWVAALGWVAANVTAFGGDPGTVTVFGQSAGAAAVRTLLSVPAARGLFRRGIIQSAGFEDYAVVASPSADRVAQRSAALFNRLGSHDIDVLRGMPTEAVREASFLESGIAAPAGQVHTPANLVWYPAIDDDVVTEGFPAWTPDVAVLFGTTQDEARFFHRPSGLYSRPDLDPADVYTSRTLATMAEVLTGEQADDILAHFSERGLSSYEALAELSTSAVWLEPALATYRRFAGLDRDAYYYHFARISPMTRSAGLLAYHSAEIPYVFGTVSATEPSAPLGRSPAETQSADVFDEVDLAVSETMQHAWTEFARTGSPISPDGTAWPRCTRDHPRYTLIGDTTEPRELAVSALTALISAHRTIPPRNATAITAAVL